METVKDMTMKCKLKMKQTTNAFSYYIVKACLFYFDDEFMSKAFTNNDIRMSNLDYFNNNFVNDIQKWCIDDEFNDLIKNQENDKNDNNMKLSSLTVGRKISSM